MILNNNLLKLLNEFSFIARNIIGNIKLKALISDPIYARNIYVETALSGNKTLILLAKKIHQASLRYSYEFNAVEGYLLNIENLHGNKFAQSKKQYLKKLLAFLMRNQITHHTSYRQEIDLFLLTIPMEKRSLYAALARDFYHFWINEQTKSNIIPLESNLNQEQNEKLIMLWTAIQKESSLVVSGSALERYRESIQKLGFGEQVVQTRVNLAKLVINAISFDPSSNNSYRMAVDFVQALFHKNELREAFLGVAREFYYFHIGDQ